MAQHTAKPFAFDGKIENYRAWRKALLLYIDANAETLFVDRHKINVALSYMSKDSAYVWSDNYVDAWSRRGYHVTWPEFVAQLDASFVDKDEVNKLRTELYNLKQKPPESCNDFLERFDLL